jgi:hypothetical protein
MVEGLEERTLLSITFSGPSNSGVATITGGPGDNQFVIQLKPTDATMIEFSDDGGATFVDAAISGITAVNVNGMQGNDQLTIDASNGLVGEATPLPITFDGGGGLDRLVVQGTATGTITETFTQGTTAGAGTLTMTDGTVSSMVSLMSVGKIQDTMTADTLTINTNDDNNFVHIHNGPVVNGFKTDTVQLRDISMMNSNLDDHDDHHGDNGDDNDQGDDNNQGDDNGQGDDNHQGDDHGDDDEDMRAMGTLDSISFANKTNVVVTGQTGNDLFLLSIGTAADGLQNLTIDGGGGTNVAVVSQSPATVTLTLKNVQVVGTDHDSFFIEEMYEERLGRSASRSEVLFWTGEFQGSGGQQAVVNGIEESAEARTMLVKNLYARYLGRSAVHGEEQGWVRLMLNGETEEQITAAILASPEFFEHAQTLVSSGTPNERFVQALYQTILNRAASDSEVASWVSQLPTIGRFGVALGFLESNEFRTGAVDSFYSTLLQRAADAAGLTAWVQSGKDLEHIRQGFEGSAEFFADN